MKESTIIKILIGVIAVLAIVGTTLVVWWWKTPAYTGTDVGMQEPTVTSWEQPVLPPPFENLDQSDPDQVMEYAAREFFHFDPEHDQSFADAPERVEPLFTPEFYASHKNSWSAMVKLPGSVWDEWASHHAHIDVIATIQADTHPEDQSGRRARVIQVDVKPSIGKGWRYSVYMTIESHGWWRVSDLEITQPVAIKNNE
ncbi:hypothetical protein GSS88_00095 [Corynebacterium sp. 3HC-13]|uniref:hypothetical protein n=1 Tax=Corynebacterium poyangense TaxID=2684405 RepID=UPI001CD02CB5|nr:hypothetical protein [Corynebacterium poyangense]MBZ8176210.1 hypothetical protein [Corynebacterium poyangense]